MSGEPDLHILTVPHLKAYDRSSLRTSSPSVFSQEENKGSPSKYGKALRGNVFGGWLPGSPFASSVSGPGGLPSSSSSSSNFSRQTLCFLIILIAATSLVSLRYLGFLSKFLQQEDLNKSPAILTISRHEAKQTEKLIELMGKVDEMRERVAQTVTSLEDLLGKAVAQQDQMKSIEDQLRQAGQAQGQAVQSPPQAQAAVSALEERMAELGSAMRRQMSSLSESLNATLVGVTAHSQQLQGRRERALGEARLGQGLAGGQEGQGRGLGLGAGLGGDSGSDPGLSERAVEQELLRVVGKVEEKVEEAGERSASVLGRVEEKLGLLAGRLDSLAHSSALKASPSVLHMEGQQAGAGSEGHGGGKGLPADGEALRRIEAQVAQLAAGLGKGPAGKEAVAGGVGTEVASQVARLLENVRRLRESSGAGDGTRRRPENGTTLAGAGAGAAAGGVAGLGSAGGDQVGPRVPGTGAGSGAGEGTGEPRQCAALASQVRLQAAAVSELRQRLNAFKEAQREDAEESAGGPQDGGETSQRHASISPRALRTWRQGSFQKAGSYGFIAFSGYRTSKSSFVSVGFGLVALRNTRSCATCVWTATALSLRGKARLVYPQDDHGAPYEAVLIMCEFDSTVPAGGGHLAAYIDHELVLLYKEEAEAFRDSLDPAWPFPAGLSFCLPPLSSRALHPVLLRQFLVYHWRTGADAFVLYDAGALGEDARGLLAAEVQRGVVDVVDFWEIRKYNIYNYGEVVALHDCIYRLRYTSEWVAYADMDDYLWTPQVPQNLKNSTLIVPTSHTSTSTKTSTNRNSTGHSNSNSHGEALSRSMRQMMAPYSDVAGVTIGSLWFSVNKCRSRGEHLDEVLMPAIAARPVQGLPRHERQGQGHTFGQEGLKGDAGTADTGRQSARRRILQEGAAGGVQGQVKVHAEEGAAVLETAGTEAVSAMAEQQGEFGTASGVRENTLKSESRLEPGAGTKEQDPHALKSHADSAGEAQSKAQGQGQSQAGTGDALPGTHRQDAQGLSSGSGSGTPAVQDAQGLSSGSGSGTPAVQDSSGMDNPRDTVTGEGGVVPGSNQLSSAASLTRGGGGGGGAGGGGSERASDREGQREETGPEADLALNASEVRRALLARPSEAVVQQEMAVEQFVFHWPEPACFGNHEKGVNLDSRLCPGRRGHRRFVVNPRKVERMTTFGPLEADVNNVEFVHLVTSDAVFLHYDGLGTRLRPGGYMCNETEPMSRALGWWRTEPSYARTMASIRMMQPCNFSTSGWDGCYNLRRG